MRTIIYSRDFFPVLDSQNGTEYTIYLRTEKRQVDATNIQRIPLFELERKQIDNPSANSY